MKPQSKPTRLQRLISNRGPGILTSRTTKGVVQRPFRSAFTVNPSTSTVPRWG